MRKMQSFDKDNIPEQVITRLQPVVTNPEFNPDKIKKVSKTGHVFCLWVQSMIQYHRYKKAEQSQPSEQSQP